MTAALDALLIDDGTDARGQVICSIAGYPIDVMKTTTPKLSAKVTTSPVEKGADLTDNIQQDPFELSCDCLVTDTPGGAIATDPTRTGSAKASRDCYDRLVAIWKASKPVTVITHYGTHVNMAMTNVSAPRDASTGQAIAFTVDFIEITIIENQRVTVHTSLPGGGGQNHLGDHQAITLSSDKTWVISYLATAANRARVSKVYGPPIVAGTVSAPGASTGSLDRYKVDPNRTTPDGYVDKAGKYTPFAYDPKDGKKQNADALYSSPSDQFLNDYASNFTGDQ